MTRTKFSWRDRYKPVFNALESVVEAIEPFEIEEQVELYDYAVRNLSAMGDFKQIICRHACDVGVEEDAAQ